MLSSDYLYMYVYYSFLNRSIMLLGFVFSCLIYFFSSYLGFDLFLLKVNDSLLSLLLLFKSFNLCCEFFFQCTVMFLF